MDAKKLEELSLEMARTNGITQKEAARSIADAMKGFAIIKEAIVTLGKALAVVLAQILESIKNSIEELKESRYSSTRQTWPAEWNTRKKS